MIAMGSPKAGIEHKGLFLNADAGFDSKSVRDFLESKEIIANIKKNIFFIIVVFLGFFHLKFLSAIYLVSHFLYLVSHFLYSEYH